MVVVNYQSEVFNEGKLPSGIPLTYLLSQLDLSALVQEIENHYYSLALNQRFHYRVDLMLKLWIYKQYHQFTFRTVMEALTLSDLSFLLTETELKKYRKGMFKLPSPSALHHFITYRLGPEGVKFVMSQLGAAILHLLNTQPGKTKGLVGIIDSTPLIASRYSPYAVYNPHYETWMAKAHIISTDGYPLYMIFSEGTEDDGKYGHLLVNAVKSLNPQFSSCLCDGGYDNFLMYAEIHEELHAQPIINIRENASFHGEASRKAIWKIVNSKWKEGGDVWVSHQKKLEFLYNLQPDDDESPTKYKELVGMNIRNKNMLNYAAISKQLEKRGRCEELHSQLKNVLKFNVMGCRRSHRALYTMLDFITAQSMLLAYLQNNSHKKTLSGFI